ncbi:MAG: L,D-transpeptidase [Hyphomicrobiaceae bacterium]
MSRLATRCLMIVLLLVLSAPYASASVRVRVDLSSQRMQVFVNGSLRHVWRVSTGRRGYSTPTGTFRPTRLERRWYSRKYNWSPMPHSIFFVGGVAIHGSYHTRQLGRRASHGCVRLAPRNAARLFGLVRRHGARRTRIQVAY